MRQVFYERVPGEPVPEPIRRELAQLDAVPDEQIDFSEIPKQKSEDWKSARLFKDVYSRTGKSVLLDDDILAWLKAGGPGHRERANQILRERMLAERSKSKG